MFLGSWNITIRPSLVGSLSTTTAW